MRIAILGAGIFGVTAALELRRRGHAVVLYDVGPLPHPDAASTDISKAVRMDYGADAFYTALMERAFVGWRRWNADFGVPLYHEDGVLFMSREALAPGGFEHDSLAVLRARGHAVERLDAAAIAARFPAWGRAGVHAEGYFNPTGGWAASGRVAGVLAEQARREGVAVRLGARPAVEAVERDADVVVVAAGAWTPKLLPELADVMWATAQTVMHFSVGDPAAWQPPRFPVWGADIARTGWYGFPAQADGVLKIAHHGEGEPVDPDAPRGWPGNQVPPGEEARFRAFLREALPDLADAPLVGARRCLYCDTFDGDFWIDRHPDRPTLVVAAGGSGHGFKFAPVLGELIADAVEGRGEPRFRWRARGDRRREAARA